MCLDSGNPAMERRIDSLFISVQKGNEASRVVKICFTCYYYHYRYCRGAKRFSGCGRILMNNSSSKIYDTAGAVDRMCLASVYKSQTDFISATVRLQCSVREAEHQISVIAFAIKYQQCTR